MKRIILGVAAALFLSAGQAAADGLPSRSHVKGPDSGPSWNGFSLGLGVGVSAAVTNVEILGGLVGFDGIGGEGLFGTVSLGYDRVLAPGWVGGVFTDYDFGGAETDLSIVGINLLSLDQTYTWSIGARLGFLANAGTLVYGTVGYTQTELELSIVGLSLAETYSGYFVGAGVETFLNSRWTAKLEYRYSEYDAENPLSGLGVPSGIIDFEPSTHAVRGVVSYKFGH
jgi:outer membrane immunogenic protein